MTSDVAWMVVRFFAVSLPNVATIFIGIGLFCRLFPRKHGGALTLCSAVACCLAAALCSFAVAQALIPLMPNAFVGDLITCGYFILVILFCLWLCCRLFVMGTWDAVFCCTAGYALQNLGHSTYDMLTVFTPLNSASVFGGALMLAISVAIFAVAWRTFIQRIRVQHLEGSGDARTILVLVGVIAVNIILSTTINTVRSTPGIGLGSYAALRFCALVVSILMLFLDYEILYSNHMRIASATAKQMMEDERRQYQLSADTIEAINVRCHDIRHQVRRLQEGGATGAQFMEGLADLISVYDSGVQTGNRALDVILTEKSLLCNSKQIQLTCVADGSALAFMEEQDVYSFFGNALDNAIEAAEKLDDPDLRIIDESVRQVGQMASVQVRNYFTSASATTASAGRGGLATTKTDGGLHGYGTKSMSLIAERYDGTLSFSAEDGLFRLVALFPSMCK